MFDYLPLGDIFLSTVPTASGTLSSVISAQLNQVTTTIGSISLREAPDAAISIQTAPIGAAFIASAPISNDMVLCATPIASISQVYSLDVLLLNDGGFLYFHDGGRLILR